MSEDKKHKTFTASDIEKYHKGMLSAGEMHELEKAALEDPFLADALEGYGSVGANVSGDLSLLQQKLQERITGSKIVFLHPTRKRFKWWTVAAAVILFGGVGFLTFKLAVNKRDNSVAETRVSEQQQPAAAKGTGDSSVTKKSTDVDSLNNNRSTEANAGANLKVRPTGKHRARTGDTINNAEQLVTSAGVATQTRHGEENDSVIMRENAAPVAAPIIAKKKRADDKAAAPQAAVDEKREFAGTQQAMNHFTGRVVDASNNPLPFANISNTRDNVGTYADARGYFTLISTDSILNVQVRSIGFENRAARLKNDASNQVVLQEDKTGPVKTLSFRMSDTNRSRAANMQLEEPEPLDGWTNYSTYMANNINVPDDVKTTHDNGQVQVSFDVNRNGDPVNIKVERSLCKKCDEEAVRLIKQGPKWKKKSRSDKRVTVNVPFPTE